MSNHDEFTERSLMTHDLARGGAQADRIGSGANTSSSNLPSPSSPLQDSCLSPVADQNSQTGEPSVESLMQVITDLQESEAQAIHDRDLADRECRRLRRACAVLQRELDEVREEEPKAKQIREVLDYWKDRLGKNARTIVTVTSDRGQKVRARMNEGITVARLKKAIDGMAAYPYVGPKGRVATGDKTQRHDDITIICAGASDVERFEGYAERWEAEQQTCSCSESTGDFACPVHKTAVQRATRYEDESVERQFVRYAYDGNDQLEHKPARGPKPRVRDEFKVPPVDKVIPALNAAGCELKASASDPDRWWGKCPAHDDRNPSFQTWRKPDGRMGLKCWTGCSEDDILRAAGLEHADCWRGSEYDTGAQDYLPGTDPSPHLQETLRQINSTLASWDRRAA